MSKDEGRINRQFDRIQRRFPAVAGFLNWLKVDAVEKIRAKDYDRAVALLDKKIAAKQKH